MCEVAVPVLAVAVSAVPQLLVVARDQGSPQQTGTTLVTVRVTRNQFPPVFSESRYEVTIAETYTPSLPIITVQADDADPPVSLLS